MKAHLITFGNMASEELNPHHIPNIIQERVDPFAKKIAPSSWLVRTNLSPEDIKKKLRPEIVRGDQLTVTEISAT